MVFADGSSGRYDQVLACDGNRSTVRQALRLPFDGIDLPHEWGVADVSVVGSRYPASFALFMVENGAMVVVAPMAAGRVRVIANRPDPLALLPVPLDRRSTLAEGRFRISIRQVPRYSLGRVHLAGDAAHCHSPVGGRGMNLGIADAAAFARHLAQDTLAEYSPERHRDGAETIRLSEVARRRLDGQSRAGRAPVRLLAWLASHVAPVERLVMRTAMGL